MHLSQRLTDVVVVASTAGAFIGLVALLDRIPLTRRLLDTLDPSRVVARHPSGAAKPTGTVRVIPRVRPFDAELDA